MKRSDIATFIAVVICILVLGFTILFVFQESMYNCLSTLATSIFSGAIISLPSIMINLYIGKKNNTVKVERLLFKISSYMQNDLSDSQNYLDETAKTKIKYLALLYKDLTEMTEENVFSHHRKINSIQDSLFHYLNAINILRQDFESNQIETCQGKYESDCKKIVSLKVICIGYLSDYFND